MPRETRRKNDIRKNSRKKVQNVTGRKVCDKIFIGEKMFFFYFPKASQLFIANCMKLDLHSSLYSYSFTVIKKKP